MTQATAYGGVLVSGQQKSPLTLTMVSVAATHCTSRRPRPRSRPALAVGDRHRRHLPRATVQSSTSGGRSGPRELP